MTTAAGACLAASLDDSGLFRKAVHEEGFIGIGVACKRGLNGRDWGGCPRPRWDDHSRAIDFFRVSATLLLPPPLESDRARSMVQSLLPENLGQAP